MRTKRSASTDPDHGSSESPPALKSPRTAAAAARKVGGEAKGHPRTSSPKKARKATTPPPRATKVAPKATPSKTASPSPSSDKRVIRLELEENCLQRHKIKTCHVYIDRYTEYDPKTRKTKEATAIYVGTAVLAQAFGHRFSGEDGEMRLHVGAPFTLVLPGFGSVAVTVEGERGKISHFVAKGANATKLNKLLLKAKIKDGKNWVLLFACQKAAGGGYTIPTLDATTPDGLPVGVLPAKTLKKGSLEAEFPPHAFKLGMLPVPKESGTLQKYADPDFLSKLKKAGFKEYNLRQAIIMQACLCKNYNFRAFRYPAFGGAGPKGRRNRHLFYRVDDSGKRTNPLRLIGWSDRSMSYVFKGVNQAAYNLASGNTKNEDDEDSFLAFFRAVDIWTGDRIVLVPVTSKRKPNMECKEWVVTRLLPHVVDAAALRAKLAVLG